jgi:integrase
VESTATQISSLNTCDELVHLSAEVDHHRYAAVVAIMFTVGLRVSEVLGLGWCDIDLDAGTADVRRAVVAGEGGRRFGPTKTEARRACTTSPREPSSACSVWNAQQAEERLLAGPLWRTHTFESQPLDPVFTKQDGGLVARQQIDRSAGGRTARHPNDRRSSTQRSRRTVQGRLQQAPLLVDETNTSSRAQLKRTDLPIRTGVSLPAHTSL